MPASNGKSESWNISNIFYRRPTLKGPTVDILVGAVAHGATDLCMGHDRFCMRLQVKWGNVPELAALGFDCCLHFLLPHILIHAGP